MQTENVIKNLKGINTKGNKIYVVKKDELK